MSLSVGPHLDAETAEKYSMGKLSARKKAELEKHLLICEACQKTLTASDAYVAAMQKAAAKVRAAEKKPQRWIAAKEGRSYSTR